MMGPYREKISINDTEYLIKENLRLKNELAAVNKQYKELRTDYYELYYAADIPLFLISQGMESRSAYIYWLKDQVERYNIMDNKVTNSDLKLISELRTTIDDLKERIIFLEDKAIKTSEFAAQFIGKACADHAAQCSNMPFVEFRKKHESLGCHWCVSNRVNNLENVLRRIVERLKIIDPATSEIAKNALENEV